MSQFNTGGSNDSGRSDYDRDDVSRKVGEDCERESGSQLADASRGQSWGGDGHARLDGQGGTGGKAGTNRSRYARDAAETLQSHADIAKEKIAHAADEVGHVAHELGSTARGVAREVGGAASELKSTASQFAERERGRAADVVSILADAIRDAGRRLMEEPRTREVGILGDMAAEKVQGASTYLRDHSTTDLVRTCSHLARRNPEIFLGAMATAGLALARFIKATERRPEPTPEPGYAPQDTDMTNDWTPGGSRYQPVISDYPANVSAREAEAREARETGTSEGFANTTPEDELPADPTPGSERTRLTEEGI